MLTTVDTSAMSLGFRGRIDPLGPGAAVRAELDALSSRAELLVPGVVRQELLSGLREEATFRRLRGLLRAFPDVACTIDDYERAAEFANTCQRSGVQGARADFLVCATSVSSNSVILTLDGDFARFAQYIPIRLHPLSRT